MQEDVDPERIGIIGICGWGGMALNAAAIDTRIKATAAMTMYDMTRVTANGYFDAEDSEQARLEKREALNAQRTEDYRNGSYALAGGVVDPLPEDAPQFVRGLLRLLQDPARLPSPQPELKRWLERDVLAVVFEYADPAVQPARSAPPCLLVHGEKAHSRYFSETAYGKLTGRQQGIAHISPAPAIPTSTIRWISFRLKS